MVLHPESIIAQTKKWIDIVVIGCNFCPFASKEVKNNSIKYVIDDRADEQSQLTLLKKELQYLNENASCETTLIIYPNQYPSFEAYLAFVEQTESLLAKQKYKGVYQLATFHPQYCFEGEDPNDASNYTNRSIYPMIHILREESIYKIASKQEEYLESIPGRNIAYALAHGSQYFEELIQECKKP
jgi:uncharacterized protein